MRSLLRTWRAVFVFTGLGTAVCCGGGQDEGEVRSTEIRVPENIQFVEGLGEKVSSVNLNDTRYAPPVKVKPTRAFFGAAEYERKKKQVLDMLADPDIAVDRKVELYDEMIEDMPPPPSSAIVFPDDDPDVADAMEHLNGTELPIAGGTSPLDIFVKTKQEDSKKNVSAGLQNMEGNTHVSGASNAGQVTDEQSRNIRNGGGNQAQDTKINTATAVAGADQQNSWGTHLDRGVQGAIIGGAAGLGGGFGSGVGAHIAATLFPADPDGTPAPGGAASAIGQTDDHATRTPGRTHPPGHATRPHRDGRGPLRNTPTDDSSDDEGQDTSDVPTRTTPTSGSSGSGIVIHRSARF